MQREIILYVCKKIFFQFKTIKSHHCKWNTFLTLKFKLILGYLTSENFYLLRYSECELFKYLCNHLRSNQFIVWHKKNIFIQIDLAHEWIWYWILKRHECNYKNRSLAWNRYSSQRIKLLTLFCSSLESSPALNIISCAKYIL